MNIYEHDHFEYCSCYRLRIFVLPTGKLSVSLLCGSCIIFIGTLPPTGNIWWYRIHALVKFFSVAKNRACLFLSIPCDQEPQYLTETSSFWYAVLRKDPKWWTGLKILQPFARGLNEYEQKHATSKTLLQWNQDYGQWLK
jgi:hypothetical protein